MAQQNKKKRKRRVQPRFYVIISIFTLLILVLFFLIAVTIVGCVHENRTREQFRIEEERLQADPDNVHLQKQGVIPML